MFKKALSFLKDLVKKNEPWYRQLDDGQWLKIDGKNIETVPQYKVPYSTRREQEKRDDNQEQQHDLDTDRVQNYAEKDHAKQVRMEKIDGKSPEWIADQAADNHYIMQDILNDPSILDVDTEVEAVAKVAEANPAWADLSDLTDTYDIDTEAETDTGESSATAETGDVDTDTDSSVTGVTELEVASMSTGDITSGDINGGDI